MFLGDCLIRLLANPYQDRSIIVLSMKLPKVPEAYVTPFHLRVKYGITAAGLQLSTRVSLGKRTGAN